MSKSIKPLSALLIVLGVFLTSCQPQRLSYRDPHLFMESPIIVKRADKYFLRYRFAKGSFLFSPDSRIDQGRLIFFLEVTTSTGNPGGKIRELEIENPKQIEALKGSGVFWEEQDRSLIKIEMIEE